MTTQPRTATASTIIARVRPATAMGFLLACVTLLEATIITIEAAEPPITALTFTLDGSHLLVGSQSGLRCYQWPDLTTARNVATNVDNIQHLAFAPNGRYLAVSGGQPAESGRCQIIAWPEGQPTCTLDDHHDLVTSTAWSSASDRVATASMDGTVMVTTLASRAGRSDAGVTPESGFADTRQKQRLTGHSKGVLATAFLDHPPLLLTAGIDRSIRIWQIDSAQPLVRTLQNHTEAIHALAGRANNDGALPVCLSIGADRTVRLWQPTIGRMMRFTRFEAAIPLSAQWHPDGSWIAVGCSDGHVRVIDPQTTELIADRPAQSGWCYALAVHPATGEIAVGGPDGVTRVSLD